MPKARSSDLTVNDMRILGVLSLDARASIAKISRATGIQRDSVAYRMRRLLEKGIIEGFSMQLNSSFLGFTTRSIVHFALHNFTLEDEKKFLSALRSHASVVSVAKTTGAFDVEIVIVAKSLMHHEEVLSGFRQKFAKIIKDYASAHVLETTSSVAGLVPHKKSTGGHG